MISWSRRELLRALSALPVVACGSDRSNPDGGVDAALDGASEAAPDVGPDAAPELCPGLARHQPRGRLPGAAGDGKTNDTFQRCRKPPQLKDGGELTIPPGTYVVGKQDGEGG